MKLLVRTTIFYVLLSVILFSAGGVVFFFSLQDLIREEVDEKLEARKIKVIRQIRDEGAGIPSSFLTDDLFITEAGGKLAGEEWKDTVIYDTAEEERIPVRQLRFGMETGGKNYEVVVRHSLLESEDLGEGVMDSLLNIFIGLLVLFVIANYFLSRSVWKPFRATLGNVLIFDPSRKKDFKRIPTGITEFQELNRVLDQMADRVKKDFENLKEFSENASHEMQTPLAIIRTNLEQLLQTGGLSGEALRHAKASFDAAGRLSRLNQSLVILSRIENREYGIGEEVDFSSLVKTQLEQMEELARLKGITVERKIEAPVTLRINRTLGEVLVSNLLSNAIRHSREQGAIGVEVSAGSMMVSNTGEPLTIPAEKLFGRFVKGDPSSSSPGLGLAIVKKIADAYGFQVGYTYGNSRHHFLISFHGKQLS